MPDWAIYAALLLALNLTLVVWMALRRPDDHTATAAMDRLEGELRDQPGRQGQGMRADLATFQQMLLAQSGDVARTQNEQIDSFFGQLAATQMAGGGAAPIDERHKWSVFTGLPRA